MYSGQLNFYNCSKNTTNWQRVRGSNPCALSDSLFSKQDALASRATLYCLAEVVGFEPTDPFEPSVFKTAALSHTQPHFHNLAGLAGIEPTPSGSKPEMISISPKTVTTGAGSRVRTDDILVGNETFYH